eukprot:7321206-Alexandrium_andersonii.AAC.1
MLLLLLERVHQPDDVGPPVKRERRCLCSLYGRPDKRKVRRPAGAVDQVKDRRFQRPDEPVR